MTTKKGMGKHKGSRFENKIYDDIRKENILVRKNKGSGNAEDNKGDLETQNLLIECKHYKKVTDKMVNNWMQKIYNESSPLGKYPILIVKENYVPIKVYYLDKNMQILYLEYSYWLTKFLESEKVKKPEIPSYIG